MKQDKEKEVEFFEEVAHSIYTEREDLDSEYLKVIRTAGLDKLQGKVVGELGSGTGIFGRYISNNGNTVKGFDISPEMVRLNKERSEDCEGYTVHVGDIEERSLFSGGSLDVVVCPFILHHLPSIDKVFKNINFWLKPGGRVFILEPNGSNPVNVFSKAVLNFLSVVAPALTDKVEWRSVNEIKDHSFKDYKTVLDKNGFQITKARSIIIPPYKFLGFNTISLFGFLKFLAYRINSLINLFPISRGLDLVITAKRE